VALPLLPLRGEAADNGGEKRQGGPSAGALLGLRWSKESVRGSGEFQRRAPTWPLEKGLVAAARARSGPSGPWPLRASTARWLLERDAVAMGSPVDGSSWRVARWLRLAPCSGGCDLALRLGRGVDVTGRWPGPMMATATWLWLGAGACAAGLWPGRCGGHAPMCETRGCPKLRTFSVGVLAGAPV
jgi:hypothetical protein